MTTTTTGTGAGGSAGPVLLPGSAAAKAAARAATRAAQRRQQAARNARLVGTAKPHGITVKAGLVHRCAAVIDTSGLPDWLDGQLPDQDPTQRTLNGRRIGGRRRTLTTRALLTGLLLLPAAEQSVILRDVARLLNALPPSLKHELSVPRPGEQHPHGVTERMVSKLFGDIVELLDPSPHSRRNRLTYETAKTHARTAHATSEDADNADILNETLQALREQYQATLAYQHTKLRYVLDRGIEATLPSDTTHTGSYAIDASALRTWARQNRKAPKAPWLHPDPDAAWNGKNTHTTPGWYGYWLHGIVRVGEVGSDPIACLTERIELTAANADSRAAGVELLTRMVADHETTDQAADQEPRPRRDLLADRGYTPNKYDGSDWTLPVYALGFTSVHDLTEAQTGHTGTLTSGALIVDGQPYSPRLPDHLRAIARPRLGTTRAGIATYQALIAQRGPYALHAVGGRHHTDGYWDFGCRAMKVLGQLRCDLKPQSLTLALTRPTTDPTLGGAPHLPICGQQKARIEADELPLWQPDPYGSSTWYASYNRRNHIEGIFGNIKNDAAQSIERGNIRVMGLAKTSLLVLFTVMAANLRLLDAHHARTSRTATATATATAAGAGSSSGGAVVKKRQPRYRTQLKADTRKRIEARQAHDATLNALTAALTGGWADDGDGGDHWGHGDPPGQPAG